MSNELALAGVPSFLLDTIRKTAERLSKIKSYNDVENMILRGQGLSERTYRVYMTTVKMFGEFHGGLPLDASIGDLERWYDSCKATGVKSTTLYNRIAALRNFYLQVEKRCPGYVSPFRDADERLDKKFKHVVKPAKKKALTKADTKAVLEHLAERTDDPGKLLHASLNFLLASGLRVSELCALRWKDVDFDGDTERWSVTGIGKGEKPFVQEVANPAAIGIAREYFRDTFRRDPKPEDFMFWNVPRHRAHSRQPLQPHALRHHLAKLGEELREKGIVTRDYQWSPHLLRRTAGTLLDKQGMSVVGIQHFLRHSSVDTTARHYIDNTESAAPYLADAVGG